MWHWLTNYTSAVVLFGFDLNTRSESWNKRIQLSGCRSAWNAPHGQLHSIAMVYVNSSEWISQQLLSKWRWQNERYILTPDCYKRSASIEIVARDARCKFQVPIKNNRWRLRGQRTWTSCSSFFSPFDLACYNSDNLFHCIGNSVFFHRLCCGDDDCTTECVFIKRKKNAQIAAFFSTCGV